MEVNTVGSKKINKTAIRKMVLCAVFIALIIALSFIPNTGYINTPGLAITTLHVIVIVGSVMLGWKYGLVLGAVWGILCEIVAVMYAEVMFYNPIVSVMPRILVGFVAAVVFRAVSKTKLGIIGGCIVAAIAGTLTNTVLVLSMLYIFGGTIKEFSDAFNAIKDIILVIISVNGGVELAIAVILTPAIVRPLYPTLRSHGIMQ